MAHVPRPPREELVRMRWHEHLQNSDIAKMYGTSTQTVSKWFREEGIPSLSVGEARMIWSMNYRMGQPKISIAWRMRYERRISEFWEEKRREYGVDGT